VKRDVYAGGPSARYLLLGSAAVLILLGTVMIFSAASVSDLVRRGTSSYHFLRQLAFVGAGVVAALALDRFDYRRLRSSANALWTGAVVLLVATFALGVVRGGARRWIPLGLFNLQPSELAKVACVLAAAALVVEWRKGKLDTRTFLYRACVLVGLPALLVVLQPDLGTAVSLVMAVAIVLFLGGIPLRWITVAALASVGLAVLGIMAEPYRIKRVLAFMDPWDDPMGKGYQTIQALIAFGTGGLDGLGLGMSRQKFFYLPEAHTDFIFAIIGEELGLIGTLAVVVAFCVFLYAGVRIALGARDDFGRLVAGGLTGMIAVQAVMNMAAVTGVMPVTGKPLPFLSFGGSSMLVTMICLGLILSVSRFGARAPGAVRVRPARSEKAELHHASADERRQNSRTRQSGPGGRGTARRRA
jgi:cell division protein FtsW